MTTTILPKLNDIVPALGVMIREAEHGFEHLATCWHLGDGGWVSALTPGAVLPEDARIVTVADGACYSLESVEERDGVLGIQASGAAVGDLSLSSQELGKRAVVSVVAYPEVIDHPLLQLSRRSLTATDYVPFLCPWSTEGHIALFSADDGFVTGSWYAGMNGAPVLDSAGAVLGVAINGSTDANHPPLIQFRRLSAS